MLAAEPHLFVTHVVYKREALRRPWPCAPRKERACPCRRTSAMPNHNGRVTHNQRRRVPGATLGRIVRRDFHLALSNMGCSMLHATRVRRNWLLAGARTGTPLNCHAQLTDAWHMGEGHQWLSGTRQPVHTENHVDTTTHLPEGGSVLFPPEKVHRRPHTCRYNHK